MRSSALLASSRLASSLVALALAGAALGACNTGPKEPEPQPTAPATTPAAPAAGALRLGAPIEASAEKVSLTDVAKNPSAFVGKKFATSGTVSAVCQHRGCWMELKDDSGEAHVKMAGHAFFVPRTASGRNARVLATLVKAGDDGACGEGSHDTMAAAGRRPDRQGRREGQGLQGGSRGAARPPARKAGARRRGRRADVTGSARGGGPSRGQ